MLNDLRYALRGLRRTPGFAVTAMLTLALGVGANTAIFSVIHNLLIDPLPYPGGDRMVFLWRHNARMGGLVLPPTQAMTEAWRQGPATDGLEIYRSSTSVLTGATEPEEITTLAVRPGIFDFLALEPRLGRAFVESDAAGGAEPVALISEALRRRRFAGDREALGGTIVLDDVAHTIVGVMTPAFQFRESHDDVWVPLAERALKPTTTVSALGRLAPGVTPDSARAQLDAALAGVPGTSGWTAYVMTPGDRLGSGVRTSLLVLAGAVGFLLLIVCANVANLLLARNAAREKEVAIRGALGAGRWRIARQFAVESLVLAAGGGVAGLVVSLWLLDLVFSLRPEGLTGVHRVGLNVPVLAFGALISLVTGLAFGLLPSLHGARLDLVDSLKIGGRSSSGPARQWVRRGLTAAQVALALVLLVGAGLLARSYTRLQAADLGFEPDGLVSMRFDLPASSYRERALRADAVTRLLEGVRAVPGAARASVGPGLPPQISIRVGRLRIEGRTLTTEESASVFGGGAVDPQFFRTLAIPLKEGRAFAAGDRAGSPPVAIVNESFARRFWPGDSAIGRRIALSSEDEWQTIVGVVGDVRAAGVKSDIGGLQVYTALAQEPASFGVVVVRSDRPFGEVAAALKSALWSVDPKLPPGEILTGRQVAATAYARTQFNLVLLSALAGLGLVLAAVGLYGVVSFLTAQRMHEFGVRLALGAGRRDIVALVLRQSAVMTAAGLGAGLAAAVAVSRLLERLLYEVRPTDPLTLTVVAVFLLGIALLASWLPARRAARLDPISALKAE